MPNDPDHELLAREHGLTEAEVSRVFTLAAERLVSAEGLRREMLLEARRLGHLKQMLFKRAMQDGDLAAGALYIKASERLATMVGMNSPLGHVISVVRSAPEVRDNAPRRCRVRHRPMVHCKEA